MMGYGRPGLKQVPVAIGKGKHCTTDELTAGLLRQCGLWGLFAGVVGGTIAGVLIDKGHFGFVAGYGACSVMGWLIAAVVVFGRAARRGAEEQIQ